MPPEVNIDSLIQMIMQMLTTPPEQPAGELAGGTTPMGPPAFAQTPDPQGAQLMQLLQMLQMAQSQSPQQAQNAVQGQQGAIFGAQGGRPVGS